jgi:chaperonin GroES
MMPWRGSSIHVVVSFLSQNRKDFMSKLRPLGDRLVVQELTQETKTKSGIVLPESAKEKSNEAKVVAIGPGFYQDGKLIAPDVKVGDTVLYSEYAGQKIKVDGEEFQIIRLDDVLAVLTK